MIRLTQSLIEALRARGVSTLLRPGASFLPEDTTFEPPCAMKWMSVSHSLKLGAFSYAVSGFYFGCRIGRYCSFGEQVQIGRHGHPMHWISTSPFFYQNFPDVLDQPLPDGVELTPSADFSHKSSPVVAKTTNIGHDVWIGHGAFVLPGVSIGNGAAIAAHAVVTKDVPPYAVVAGVPARIMRYRFSDSEIEALQQSRWWEFAPWQLKAAVVDDIDTFVTHVQQLRAAGTQPYTRSVVVLADLAAE